MEMTLDKAAAWLCVEPDDVRYLLADYLEIDLPDLTIPVRLCGELKNILEPCGERTCEPRIL